MGHDLELSIVIPVYNEKDRIQRGLEKILKFLDRRQFSWELIVIDDGSDDFTPAIAEGILEDTKQAMVIRSRHLGKGGAIRKGVLKSRGKWVLYLDIDLATPIEELTRFMQNRKEYDVIIGSRKMQGAKVEVHQPKLREFGGRIFTELTNLLVTRGISDITCGFKMFRTPIAKKLFSQAQLNGWSFDAEILYLAQSTGQRIKEIPVRWRDDPQTRVNLVRDTLESFMGLLRIRLNAASGKYDLTPRSVD